MIQNILFTIRAIPPYSTFTFKVVTNIFACTPIRTIGLLAQWFRTSFSQIGPSHPLAHSHSKSSPISLHVPPLEQGLLAQWFRTSSSQV